jgi:O-methyltransferase domain
MGERLHNLNNEKSSPEEILINMIHGSLATQLVSVAAMLGVADHLDDGPKSSNELANTLEVHPRYLYRLMRALASQGVFFELENEHFEHNAASELLRTDVPNSIRYFAILKGVNWQWLPQGELFHMVKTGETAFDNVHGKNYFDYLNSDAAATDVFNKAMTGFTQTDIDAVIHAYDFSEFETIIDIGGGEGSLLAGILKKNSRVNGIVADRPEVLEDTQRRLALEGVANRCQTVAIDFFNSVPGGGNVYIMRKVIHDWDDADSIKILTNCREQMADDARLMIVEVVVPPPNESNLATLFDIEMMIYHGGAERTEAEFQNLLHESGFNLTEIIPTQSLSSIIVGKPQ